MRHRIAEFASLVLCIVLLVIIPLVVAIIVALPFAIYHVVLHGWKAGWVDLMESSRFIVYMWTLLGGAALLWSVLTYFWNRRSERSAAVPQQK